MSFPITRTAIYSALSGDSTITTAVGTYANGIPKIFNNQAVENVDPPYIVFLLGSGGFEDRSPKDEIDEVWRISSIANNSTSASGMETAESLARAVYSLFRNKPISVSGWTNFKINPVNLAHITELVGGIQWYQVIVDVRIRQAQN